MGKLKPWFIEVRWSLILLGAALLVGAAIVLAARLVAERKTQEHTQAVNRLRGVELALSNLQRHVLDTAEFRAPFEALERHGLFGEEQRVAWIEQMYALRAARVYERLEFDIGEQRILSVANRPEARSFDVRASPITVKGSFVHEGRFAELVAALRASPAGAYRLGNCTLRRAEVRVGDDAEGNLDGECRLEWITFKPRTTAGGA